MLSDFIISLLQDCKNVTEGWYRKDINDTHTTFTLIEATGMDYSDSDLNPETVELEYSFDIWGVKEAEIKEEYKKIFNILTNNNFIWIKSGFQFEPETRTYHYTLRFFFYTNKDNDYDYI